MICPHKMGWGHLDIRCMLEEGHEGTLHVGMLEQTKVDWVEGDRRDYIGERTECGEVGCILPGGHRGSHAF